MKNSKKTLLWRIEGTDLPGPSYVFGTMHVKDRQVFRYKELIFDRIDACEAFAIEFDLNEAAQLKHAGAMTLPAGQTLDQLIPEKKYQKIRRMFLKGTGFDIHNYRWMKPMVLSNLINFQILASDMDVSLDEYLWKYAQEQGKVTKGIETYEEQLAVMEHISLEYQIKGLLAMAKNFSQHRKQILSLTKLYSTNDPNLIFKATKKSSREFRKILLYNRNEVMAQRIGKMVGQQTIFCAIGAGHLGGKKGVLRLLKLQGLNLFPVQLHRNLQQP